MAFNLSDITNEKRLKAPRTILLGVPKIGKSTFASKSDRPIFIPVKGEEGIDSIGVSQFPPCISTDEVLSCIYSLYQEKHNYGTVVIDSTSALEPIIHAEICNKYQAKDINSDGLGFMRGYREACKTWRKITEGLDALRNDRNMASILIGHVKIKRFDDPAGPSYDQYQFDLNELAVGLLNKWSDVTLFCNTKVVVHSEDIGFNKEKHRGLDITGGARYLYTQSRPAHPGGGRGVFGRLPYELPLSFEAFMDAVNNAI